jgi:hypothetical protein
VRSEEPELFDARLEADVREAVSGEVAFDAAF